MYSVKMMSHGFDKKPKLYLDSISIQLAIRIRSWLRKYAIYHMSREYEKSTGCDSLKMFLWVKT